MVRVTVCALVAFSACLSVALAQDPGVDQGTRRPPPPDRNQPPPADANPPDEGSGEEVTTDKPNATGKPSTKLPSKGDDDDDDGDDDGPLIAIIVVACVAFIAIIILLVALIKQYNRTHGYYDARVDSPKGDQEFYV